MQENTSSNQDLKSYQMAIDLLSYHLGLSKEEASTQLGLSNQDRENIDHTN